MREFIRGFGHRGLGFGVSVFGAGGGAVKSLCKSFYSDRN